MNRNNVIWIAVGVLGGAFLVIVAAALIMGGMMAGMMGGMMPSMFSSAPLALVFCLSLIFVAVAVGAIVYALGRNRQSRLE